MNGQNSTQSSQFGDEDTEIPKDYSIETFAEETLGEYEECTEEPKSALEKAKDFVVESSNKVIETFKETNLVKKAAIIAGVGGLVWLGVKVIKKTAEVVKNAFKEVFDIGGWFEKKTRNLRIDTAEKVLKTTLLGTLGTVLGAALAGIVYEGIRGKLGLGEFLGAFNDKGLKGVGKLLLEKQKNGLIDLGKNVWDKIARPLGLPEYDQIKTTTEKIKEVKEEVEKGLEWLKDKIHFTAVKDNILGWFNNHNITPPDELKNITLKTVAKDLGITDTENDLWKECVKWGAYAGGGALLLFKWLTWKKVAINAALYLLLIKEGKDSWGGKEIKNLASEIDKKREELIRNVEDIPGAGWLIREALDDFSLEENIDKLLTWAKNHQAEAILTLNGLWICRALILKAVKRIATTLIKYPVYTAAFGIPLFISRKEIIQRFVNKIYDNPNSKSAIEMRTLLDKMAFVDRSKPPETLKDVVTDELGKRIPDYVISLLADPVHAITRPIMQEKLKNGEIAFGFDVKGCVWLLVQGFSIPWQLAKLNINSFVNTFSNAFSEENKEHTVLPLMVGGVEMFVFSSMMWEGLKAYKNVIGSGEGLGKLKKILKVTLLPNSKEWRFVLKSSFYGFPGVQKWLKLYQARKIGFSEKYISEILEEINKPTPDITHIKKLGNKIKETLNLGEEFELVKRGLGTHNFAYDFKHHLKNTTAEANGIIAEANNLSSEKVANIAKESIKNNAEAIKHDLQRYKGTFSNLIRRGALILSFDMDKIKKAVSSESLDESITPTVKTTIDIDEITKEIPADLKIKASKLEKEIRKLPAASPEKLEKMRELHTIKGYLTPSIGRFKLDFPAILDDKVRAEKLEELAAKIEGLKKGVQAKFKTKINEVIAGGNLDNSSTINKLSEIDKKLVIPFAKKDKEIREMLNREYKKLPRNSRTPKLKAQLRAAMGDTLLTKVTRGVEGRAKMMVLMASVMFVTDQIIHRNDAERDLEKILKELGPDLKQLLFDVLPFIGTYSNYYSAFSGREIISKKDVSNAWDRASNVMWGTVGLAGDIITVISAVPSGGTSIGANVILRLARLAKGGSKPAMKLLKLWPKIERTAERLGGWREFAKKLSKYMGDKQLVIHGLKKIEKIGMIGGTALVAGGVVANLRYGFLEGDMPEIDSDLIETTENKPSEPENTQYQEAA